VPYRGGGGYVSRGLCDESVLRSVMVDIGDHNLPGNQPWSTEGKLHSIRADVMGTDTPKRITSLAVRGRNREVAAY